MPYLKTIACLANPRKLSGRCVAGKEISATCQLGAWVRPVSSRPKQELQPNERRYVNATEPQLLDKIEISFEAPVPHEYQVENQLINPAVRWVKAGTITWHDLATAVDPFNGSLDDQVTLNSATAPRTVKIVFPVGVLSYSNP